MSANRTHWEPEVFSATYTPPPKMITVPFAPTGRETLRGFFDKLSAGHTVLGAFALKFGYQSHVKLACAPEYYGAGGEIL